MSRSRILMMAPVLALAGYLALSVSRVPSGQIAVREGLMPGTAPVVLAPGWRIVPLGLFRLVRYPAGPASYEFGKDEPLTFVTPQGAKVVGAGRLQYQIAPERAAALHARCGGDLDGWILKEIRSALGQVVSDPSISPLNASKIPRAEAEGRRILDGSAGGEGLVISALRLDRLGYEGTEGAAGGAPRASVRRKVIWFAVDSFDWRIARPLIDAGRMPRLKRLMDEGAWGNLRTILPVVSPVVWTSAATGKRPSKHGIIDFLATDPKTGAVVPVTSTLRKSRAFWNILGDGGVSVGVVGWWASFPAETVNGFIATDRISFQLFKQLLKKEESADDPFKTYPSDLYPQLAPLIKAPAAVTPQELSRFIDLARYGSRFDPDDRERVQEFTTAVAAAQTYTAIAKKLFRERPTDFRAVYFEGPDEASHLFMPFVPPPVRTVDAGKVPWFGGIVPAYYVYQDELIGEFLDAFADKDTTIVVSSDHGFKSGEDRPETESRISRGKAADWHTLDGMVVLSGKDIRKGARILGASVLDIVPTLLYLYGMPVGEDMDGKPLTIALSEEYLAAHEPTKVATYDVGAPAPAPAVNAASEEGQEAIAKLRSLGYVEQDQPGARVNQSILDMQSGEYDKAIEGLKTTLQQKDDPDIRFMLARTYRLHDRPDLAAEQLDILLKRGWKKAVVYTEMSLLSRARKDYTAAENLLKQALAADPGFTEAHLNYGRLYAQQSRWDDALASFKRAVELDPNSGEGYNQVGVALKMLGRMDEAVETFQHAIKVTPDLMGPYNNLGIIYRDTGRMDKALEILKLGTSMSPKSVLLRNSLASLYYAQGNEAEAVKQLEAAVQIDPNYPGAYSNLASIYMARRDSVRAEGYLKRLLELEPGNIAGRLSLALVLSDLKKFDESRRLLHDLLAKQPRAPQALMVLGEVEMAGGNLAEAARLLEQSGQINGKEPRVWNDLARCYLAMGRKEDARQAMRRSLDANPKQPDVGKRLTEMGG